MNGILSWRRAILPLFLIVAVGLGWTVLERIANTASWRAAERDAAVCYAGRAGATATIPAGELLMGSEDHYPEEAPIVRVDVAAFNIDVHEVTNAQFARFIAETGYVTSAERATELGFDANGSAVFEASRWTFVPGANWRHPEGPDSSIEGRRHHPVVHVSLQDAKAYSDWAGRRLPTEAEYEFAARGGLVGADYAWGDALTPGGKHNANTWQGVFPFADTGDDGYVGRAPVGCFDPNPYGVHDLIGNVWEWTSDPFYPKHRLTSAGERKEAPDGFDPRQPGVPVGAIKGGSFLCAQNFCRRFRPAARHAQDTGLGTNHIGFRTAADAERPGE